MHEQIINFITRNRLSTTEVADALGKTGVIDHVRPLHASGHATGRVRCVFTAFESNYSVHEQLRDVQPGEVIIVFAHECDGRAILGDLVSRFVLLYKRAAALVVVGAVRDVDRLRREQYPIWCISDTPLGCYNLEALPFPADLEKEIRAMYDQGIAVCDAGGVAVIPSSRVDSEMLGRLQRIEMQEDVWYFCLNTLGWDTKEIVCDKRYLEEPGSLPDSFKGLVEDLKVPLDAPPPMSD